MRMMVAKEYEVGQIPVSGEYAIYKSGGKFFFAIGNGCTPIENLASGMEIPEETFLSLKKNYKEFSLEKDSPSPSDEEKVNRKENKAMEQEFRFKKEDTVKVINSDLQYTTHYIAFATLICSSGNTPACQPFSFGKRLFNIPDFKKKEFVILSRGYFSTMCDEYDLPLYLIAEKEEYERYTKVFCNIDREKNPLSVYIIGEAGLVPSKKEKKIYSVCYFADNGDKFSARELPDEDGQIVCDKVYRTNDFLYEVFVEATGEKEAKIKGAECIAKFIEDKRQGVNRQIDELSGIEEDMSDMVAWLRSKTEELRS